MSMALGPSILGGGKLWFGGAEYPPNARRDAAEDLILLQFALGGQRARRRVHGLELTERGPLEAAGTDDHGQDGETAIARALQQDGQLPLEDEVRGQVIGADEQDRRPRGLQCLLHILAPAAPRLDPGVIPGVQDAITLQGL